MGKKQHHTLRQFAFILLPTFILAVLLFFFAALSDLERGQGEQGRAQLEQAIRRAALACYATEGIYPPTLDYLAAHYGVQLQPERYIVHYEIFADNLMPNITVLEILS